MLWRQSADNTGCSNAFSPQVLVRPWVHSWHLTSKYFKVFRLWKCLSIFNRFTFCKEAIQNKLKVHVWAGFCLLVCYSFRLKGLHRFKHRALFHILTDGHHVHRRVWKTTLMLTEPKGVLDFQQKTHTDLFLLKGWELATNHLTFRKMLQN